MDVQIQTEYVLIRPFIQEKKGLEVKECGFNGTRCEYIKGKNFEETILKNIDTTLNEVNKIMGTNITNTKHEATKENIEQWKN